MNGQFSKKSIAAAAGVFCLFLLLNAFMFRPKTEGAAPQPASVPQVDELPVTSESYNIQAVLDTEQNQLLAEADIVWVNTSTFPASGIYLNLFPNAYANSKTLFAGGRNLEDEFRTRVNIFELLVNGTRASLRYVPISANNQWDSTVAIIPLPKPAAFGDTVKLRVRYAFTVPVASGRMGRNRAGTFYFLAQWFPKLGMYANGKWVCYHYHPFAEFYSPFATYKVAVRVPGGFTAAAPGFTGVAGTTYNFSLTPARDFAFTVFSSDAAYQAHTVYSAGKPVTLRLLLQPANTGKEERYLAAATKAFAWLGQRFGAYPYTDFVVTDVPGSAASVGSMEYPGLITLRSPPYSPASTLVPESIIIHEIVHQYFYGVLASNEAAEPWLDEGFAEYLTARVLEEATPTRRAYFNLFGYYPIRGLLFLDLQQIPLIYTLTNVQVPVNAEGMRLFLEYGKYGALSDSAYNFGLRSVYGAVAYTKANLFLRMLERYAGRAVFDSILTEYTRAFRFKHPSANDFFTLLRQRAPAAANAAAAYYTEAGLVDNEILRVHTQPGSNTAVVYLRSSRKSSLPLDVALYTIHDTIVKQVIPNGSVAKIEFTVSGEVLGAEADPTRKELFDVNYANNSYFPEATYSGSLHISVQWFFWVQNLLLIFGGLS